MTTLDFIKETKQSLLRFKKDELIDFLIQQKYLAEAVTVKDTEINKLLADLHTANSKLNALEILTNEQKHLADAVTAKDTEIAKLKNDHQVELSKQLSDQKLKLQADHQREINRLNEDIAQLNHDRKNTDAIIASLAETTNDTLLRYESFLRIIQGGLDSHIELHDISSKRFKSHFNKNQKGADGK